MMKRALGNILCDLDFGVKVKDQIMYVLVNASPPKRVEVGTSPKVKVKILNFLVNASPPKAFDVVTSNSAGE